LGARGPAVDVEDFRMFRDIARTGSLTRGAELNGVSQSAASQRVQEIERRLGVTLLDRSTRPANITPAGRIYLDFCCKALRSEERLEADLDEFRARVEGAVRVACIYSVGLSDMSRLRQEFEERWPQASLTVEYLRPDKIYEAVVDDAADIGIVSYPEPFRNLTAIPWRDEPMAVAMAPSHPLALRGALSPADLNGLEFVAFDPELPIRRAIDRFLREQGVEVAVSMRFDNIQMIKEALALGAGVSILPRRAMQAEIDRGLLAAVPVNPEITRPLALLHRRGRKFKHAVLGFLELLLKHEKREWGPWDESRLHQTHSGVSEQSR
jgi:LysR family transcriptional regulator, transcriptional activator of the cysJI operon